MFTRRLVFCLLAAILWVALPITADNNEIEGKIRSRLDAIERALQEMQNSAKETDDSLHEMFSELEGSMDESDEIMSEMLRKMRATETHLSERLQVLENKLIGKVKNDSCQNTMKSDLERLQDDTKKILKFQSAQINDQSGPRSCKEVPNKVSGEYVLKPASEWIIPVFCEQVAFGGGWVVFQHRFDGSVDFSRSWAEYRDGFGDLSGEFWLGLEALHLLTSSRKHELMVEMKDYHGNYAYANYDLFSIRGEVEMYSFKLGKYNGTAGDSLMFHQGKSFTTKDRDDCAKQQGAWWNCGYANLNGVYKNTTRAPEAMKWYHFKRDDRALSYTRMMIREVV